jgi:hypothetical protein
VRRGRKATGSYVKVAEPPKDELWDDRFLYEEKNALIFCEVTAEIVGYDEYQCR